MKTNAGKDMEQRDPLLLQVHSCTAIVENNIQSSENWDSVYLQTYLHHSCI